MRCRHFIHAHIKLQIYPTIPWLRIHYSSMVGLYMCLSNDRAVENINNSPYRPDKETIRPQLGRNADHGLRARITKKQAQLRLRDG